MNRTQWAINRTNWIFIISKALLRSLLVWKKFCWPITSDPACPVSSNNNILHHTVAPASTLRVAWECSNYCWPNFFCRNFVEITHLVIIKHAASPACPTLSSPPGGRNWENVLFVHDLPVIKRTKSPKEAVGRKQWNHLSGSLC